MSVTMPGNHADWIPLADEVTVCTVQRQMSRRSSGDIESSGLS